MPVSKDHNAELLDAPHEDAADIDSDVIEVFSDSDVQSSKQVESLSIERKHDADDAHRQKSIRLYLLVPCIFLTVTLLGGLRLASPGNQFVFWKPALLCLILAVVLLILFVRGGLVALDGWFNEEFTTLKNVANASILLILFAASTQIFNSVMPEQGLPFWIVAFCFVWTLWNNLFSVFDNKKLLRSILAMFSFAFFAKYLILANLTAPASESWIRGMIENPAQEAFTWILALPKYSIGTGYLQFFAVLLYFLGLYLLPYTTSLAGHKNET